jgi:hypothetical protein
LMKAERPHAPAIDAPPSSPQGTSVVKHQKERASLLPTGSRPAPKVSTNCLEIWEREAAPAELNLKLATISAL